MTDDGPGGRRAADERGPRIVLSEQRVLGRSQTLVIFGFIVVAFLLLAYRTEIAARRAQQGIYDACQARALITKTVPDCENLR